ncbi:MAG TPA: pitrilysin family protein [Longimicrobiaceae bacterium]|nr:pitrilysin family protein [Longimicrobiaceae bacterium]
MIRPYIILAAAAGALAAACAPASQPAAPAPKTGATVVAQPPALGPLRPYQLPPIEEFRLDNGMRVILLQQRTMPLVTARAIVDAGSSYEPAEKNGLAVLTGSLLAEGTRTLTGPQLAERMEQLGAQFQTGASLSLAFATVTAVKSTFPEALRLAASALTEPSFPESEFTRVRTQAIAGWRQSQATVEGLAGEAFSRAVFEPTAAYSRPPGGTAASLERITRADVVDWHRRMYAPGNTTLLLVGDLSREEAQRLAQESFGGWRATAPQLPQVANPARPVTGTRVILVDRPGSVQSAIRVGQVGIGADDPDFLRLTALSQVLGGAFNARINQNLRERHGWTYGAFTNFNALRGTGTFLITSSVRTNATDSALVESVREYQQIASQPIPPDELRGALSNLVGSFPTSVQTVQGLAQRMQTVLLYDLPLDYYSNYREQLAALTSEDVLDVARRRLTPDAITIVVAGEVAAIEGPIRALDLGTVEVWSPAGERVR